MTTFKIRYSDDVFCRHHLIYLTQFTCYLLKLLSLTLLNLTVSNFAIFMGLKNGATTKPVNRRYSRKSILDTLKSINTRAFSSRFIPILPHVYTMLKNGKNLQPSPSSVTAVVFQVRDVLPQKRASIPHPRGRH